MLEIATFMSETAQTEEHEHVQEPEGAATSLTCSLAHTLLQEPSLLVSGA